MPIRRLLTTVSVLILLAATAVPGASATLHPRIPEGAIDLGSGAYAVELKAPTPDWYTPELDERVAAAAEQGKGVRLPPEADVDSSLLFTGIRPGSWMISPAWCTLNFVFGDPNGASAPGNSGNNNGKGKGPKKSNSGLYIGTAGHCAESGEEVVIIAAPGVLMNIGTTVKSHDNDIGDDFALIEIRPEMVELVNPSMAIVAGPTGSETPEFGDPILHVGHGVVVGTSGTARPGLVTWIGDGDEANGYGWDGAASPGDSGSGARHASGAAVGNLTHLVVGVPFLPAVIAGTDIDRMLQIAGAPLATATLVPDPLP